MYNEELISLHLKEKHIINFLKIHRHEQALAKRFQLQNVQLSVLVVEIFELF